MRSVRHALALAVTSTTLLLASVFPADAGAGWQKLTLNAGPPPIYGHSAVLDPVRNRMIVFTGFYAAEEPWALDLNGVPSWSQLQTTGTAPNGIDRRTAIYDPVGDRIVVAGWGSETMALALNDLTWSTIATNGPIATPLLNWATYDPVRHRILLTDQGKTYALDLSGPSSWQDIGASGWPMGGSVLPSVTYDPAQDRLLLYSGSIGFPQDQLWALALDPTPVWQQIAAGGISAVPRWGHTATYDPLRSRMITIGGSTNLDDVQALTTANILPEWAYINDLPAELQPLRMHSTVYDPAGDRIILFGGGECLWHASLPVPTCNNLSDDVWVLDLGGTVSSPFAGSTGRLALSLPRPNPSQGSLKLSYSLPKDAWGSLAILDVQGRLVKRLASGPLTAGANQAVWDRTDGRGRIVGAGVYLVTLHVGDEVLTRTVVVLN